MKIMTKEVFLDVCLLRKECAGRKSTFSRSHSEIKHLANQEIVGVRCSIPSMMSLSINYGLASPLNAADEPVNLVMKNPGPFLYDCMS
jgi:hypothetical protein